MKVVYEGWTVLNRDGRIVRYACGYGLQDVVTPTKGEAFKMARLLAERQDELTCGDINRWEFGTMPFTEVRKMGYRVVKAKVMVAT